MAASPAVAERLGLDSFHFVQRQLGAAAGGAGDHAGVSLLSPRDVRRIALLAFIGSIALLA